MNQVHHGKPPCSLGLRQHGPACSSPVPAKYQKEKDFSSSLRQREVDYSREPLPPQRSLIAKGSGSRQLSETSREFQ